MLVSAIARHNLSCSAASIGLQVKPEKCDDFEEIWRKRESRLKEVGCCLTCCATIRMLVVLSRISLLHDLGCTHMLNSHCHMQTPGFIRFALLRGDEAGDYISQSTVRL